MTKKVTKSEHDAGKKLEAKSTPKLIKELSAKVLSQKAEINKLKKKK